LFEVWLCICLCQALGVQCSGLSPATLRPDCSECFLACLC
jgi:hypothetical protein